MIKPITTFTLVGFCFLLGVGLGSYTNKKQTTPYQRSEDNSIIVRALDLPTSLDFAGESVPLDNFDARERLDRELLVNTYMHASTIMNIKKAHRFFPSIEKILAREGVPDDFKYLAVAESNLSNDASPAGAKGYWQFLKETGKQFGLMVNTEVDERFHLEKATVAACSYLKFMKNKYGSWAMAAAAYNMGGGNLSEAVAEQKENNYYDLNVNNETSRYLFRIIAFKEILSNPSKYGYEVERHQKYEPLDQYTEVEVRGAVPSWADFAKQYGVSYRIFKVYNPWLIDSKLLNKEAKTYYVKIPRK